MRSVDPIAAVPRLTTALSGPLPELERAILSAAPVIEHWLRGQWLEHESPFYCSVDLRNSGFKVAPVDTNLFPGGFNNLNPEFQPLCVQAAMTALEKICPDARGCVLIPENHTRNRFYLQNVGTLAKILRQAGMHVRIGSMLPESVPQTTTPNKVMATVIPIAIQCAPYRSGAKECQAKIRRKPIIPNTVPSMSPDIISLFITRHQSRKVISPTAIA